MPRNLIFAAVMLFLVLPSAARAQFTTTTANGLVTITAYTGSGGAVTVPGTINNLPVVAIGPNAFEFSAVSSVTIPSGITSIGANAFDGCNSLVSISMPNTITNLGEQAFADCGSLTSVTIPNKVTNIGLEEFSNCYSLVNITIPASVTSLEDEAFNYCSSLTSVTIPSSVTSIGDQTFAGSGLTSVTIPNGVISIGDFAFSGTNITSVTIPSSVTSLGLSPFEIASLTSITVSAQNPAFSSLNGVLFDKAQQTLVQYPPGNAGTTYTIPGTVTTVGDYAFEYCYALTGVVIPDSVTTLSEGAFYGSNGLNSEILPDSVTTLGSGAFFGCSGLMSITLGNGLTTIADSVFDGTDIRGITIPAGVTSIGDSAFQDCSILNGALFLGNAPTMGSSVFLNAVDGFEVEYYNGATEFTSPTWTDSSGDVYNSVNLGSKPGLASQSITFPSIANQVYGAIFDTGASASSGLPITYTYIGPVTISGNTVTVNGVGTVSIRARQNGNASYSAAPSVLQRFTVGQAAQTITFQPVENKTYGDGPFHVAASASTGLPVTYRVVSGPATMVNNLVMLTGGGTVVLGADQAGNADYSAAPEATTSFIVNPEAQTITFPAIGNQTVGSSFTLNATASSNLPVSYSKSGPVTISGNVVTVTGTGSVSIRAHQNGNASYLAARTLLQTFTAVPAGGG